MTPNPPLADLPVGACFIDGGEFRPIDELRERYAQFDGFVYEVVRIIDGVPLFLEEHTARLRRSALRSGIYAGMEASRLRVDIHRLVQRTGLTIGNVKIALGGGDPSGHACLASFIIHRYPDERMYANGVSVGIFPGERHDPTVKRHNPELRRRLRERLAKSGLYDLLLENSSLFLTEGSRTNVFFVDRDGLVTPPEEDVLPGITRLKVIEIATECDIPVAELKIRREVLKSFDAAFLTGTSAKLLPVTSINGRPFRVDHPLVRHLMAAYDRLIDEDIQKARAASAEDIALRA